MRHYLIFMTSCDVFDFLRRLSVKHLHFEFFVIDSFQIGFYNLFRLFHIY